MNTIKRIVVQPSYDKNDLRYAHAYELKANCAPDIDPVIKNYGCIAEGRFEIDDLCESWGKKTWGSGFEIVFNGVASSETINY